MAVSTNHNLGGHVILLRLYLIDIGMKNYRGVSGLWPLSCCCHCHHHHWCHHLCTAFLVMALLIETLYLVDTCIYIPSICT